MKIKVTATDIRLAQNSSRCSQTHCVIGRAIRRKIPTARVGVNEAYCTGKSYERFYITLPVRVERFILRYIEGLKLKPFEFTLTPQQVAILRGKS